MTGLRRACSHVGASLFAIETGLRLHSKSSTSQINKWFPAHMKNAPFSKVRDLNFSSVKWRKLELDNNIVHEKCDLDSIRYKNATSHNCLHDFLQKVKETGTDSAILKVVYPFCNDY